MNDAVLVTGASRGIGKAIALKYASKGYDVIITASKSESALKEVEELVKAHDVRCMAMLCDAASYDATVKLFEAIADFTDRLTVVVNNAAISYVGLITDMSHEDWQSIVNTNLSSLFYTSKFAVPSMVRRQEGSIVNISSVWGNVGASCEVAYSATKGGVNTFTKALAQELAPSGVRVNAIACGVIDTAMNAWLEELERQELMDEIDLGRLGTPEEIAEATYFLTSKKAGYITGQILTIDGGFI